MEILSGLEIVDLSLFFDSVLVIADIHIGYEEALNRQGIMVPRLQFEEMAKRIQVTFDKLKHKKIKTIVVNGDLKHDFGSISEQEWRNTLKFIDLLSKHCSEVVLIKGNHDNILGPIARKRNVKVADYFKVHMPINGQSNKKLPIESSKTGKNLKNTILIAHGNKVPSEEALNEVSTIIIGHEHPAISLRDGPRIEKFKCFLKGKYQKKNLIVQPSFNSIVEGTDILRDKLLSPFLKQNLDNFEVYVVEDKVYEFGKLKGLRER